MTLERVTFDATTSDGDVRYCFWNWNAHVDNVYDQFSASPTATHVFTDFGVQEVALMAVDRYGQDDSTSLAVPVSANGIAAVLEADITRLFFRARPGLAAMKTETILLTNSGPLGSDAAVTASTDGLPEYLQVSPRSPSVCSSARPPATARREAREGRRCHIFSTRRLAPAEPRDTLTVGDSSHTTRPGHGRGGTRMRTIMSRTRGRASALGVCVLCPLATILVLTAASPTSGADELPPPWPKASSFPRGQMTRFRLPFFAGLYTYPSNEPLYNVLYLPRTYDETRRYPLIIRFQPQGGAPDIGLFRDVADRGTGAVVLGVSWPLSKPDSETMFCTVTSEDHWYAATAQWAFSMFSIDRSRVFVGGFSAGGWAASSQGMDEQMRNISTHFVITGAGLRGSYTLTPFKGCPAFVAAGKNGMNHDSAVSAAQILRGARFDVTFVDEDGVGHEMGPQMKRAMLEWFDRFDPGTHADEWLAEAASLEKRNKAEACRLYASVAVLGAGDERGKRAREQLKELEGDALTAYEEAYDLLRSRRYSEATKAFTSAYRLATRARASRLVELCRRGLEEVAEWQFGEQAMAMEETFFTGRVFESCLLAQDGAARYASSASVKRWANLFRSEATKLTPDATAAARRDPSRARAQKKLVGARIAIWTGKYDAARKALEEVRAGAPDTPEALDAAALIDRIADAGRVK
jgi:hypothetical protein